MKNDGFTLFFLKCYWFSSLHSFHLSPVSLFTMLIVCFVFLYAAIEQTNFFVPQTTTTTTTACNLTRSYLNLYIVRAHRVLSAVSERSKCSLTLSLPFLSMFSSDSCAMVFIFSLLSLGFVV